MGNLNLYYTSLVSKVLFFYLFIFLKIIINMIQIWNCPPPPDQYPFFIYQTQYKSEIYSSLIPPSPPQPDPFKGPYADHILIPQGSTGSSIFFDIKWKPIFFWLQIQNFSFKFFVVLEIYTIFALPGSSGWQNSPTRTTQLKTRLDAAVAMRVYSISAGRTLH